MRKAFTLIELVVAVALLAMILSFSGIIFKVGIGAQRTAGANAEIMQKLRAITDQLNADFKALQKDGYLTLYSQVQQGRREYGYSTPANYRSDKLYYFSTGDFQSWFPPEYYRSNIARIFWGHDRVSLDLLFERSLTPPKDELVSNWVLVRDVLLLTPGTAPLPADCNDISYAECKVDLSRLDDIDDLFTNSVLVDVYGDPNSIRSLLCQNSGEIKIEWTDGTTYPDNSLAWFGLFKTRKDGDPPDISPNANYNTIEDTTNWPYRSTWEPTTQKQYWPRALKFTFRLYDSKGIIERGRAFTHIVYLKD